MPTCKICGKTLKNPNSTSHINSKFHQSKLGSSLSVKSIEISSQNAIQTRDFNELKNIVLNLEKRMGIIEKQIQNMKVNSGVKTSKTREVGTRDTLKLEKEIVKLIKQRSSTQQIKGNIPLKDLKETLIKRYNISETDFEEIILRLYRKQIFDLQPGGSPFDYQLLSPTGKKFYYLVVKR